MSSVHKDPRVRSVSASEGRSYARNPHMFIDVLRMPSIAEAVDEASRLLRLGIVRAMQCNPNADSDAETAKDTRNNKPSFQTASAQRDPVSVYSAVTKRVNKTPDEAAKKEPTKTVEAERSKAVLKGWNSAKKAGPSILSKRSMSNSASVFQPAPKREKKTEVQQSDKTKVEKPGTEPPPKDEKRKESVNRTTSGQQSHDQNNGKSSKPKDTSNGQQKLGNNKDVKENGAKSNLSQESTAIPSKISSSTQVEKNESAGEAGNQKSASEVWAKAMSASIAEKALKQKTTLMVGARRSGLPASWGQVSSSRVASKQPSVLSVLRKQSGLGPSKLQIARSGTNAFSSVTQSGARTQSVGISTSTVIPMPSTSGLEVKYVPDSEVIGGVRPNGYTVSRQGVVKPLITFNPKPKVPHKVRQTSLEKLFEAWRDNQHLLEGEALAKALRAEQEMYAAANSRVDYRAAVTVKLKEIRK